MEMAGWMAPSSSVGGHGDGAGEIGVREDDGEFVAAEAGEEVGRTEGLPNRAAELRQDDVAGRVSERVVDLLEVVDVEHQKRERQAVHAGALDLMRQLAAEVAFVPDAGQIVRVGEGEDLLPCGVVCEEQRHLGGEDLQDLLLGIGKERLVALQEEQAGRAIVELHESKGGVA